MNTILVSLGIGVFGASLLYLVFSLLKSDWPSNYSDMKNVVDSASQRNAWIYVLMRFIPMYVVAVLLASLAQPAGGNILLALVSCATLHALLTNFRPKIIRQTFRASRTRPRHLVAFWSTTASIFLATALAVSTWQYWIPVLPKSDELVQAIWTTLFIGLAAIFLRSVGTFEDNMEKRIQRAKEDLGDNLQKFIQAEAAENDVSVEFVQSIIYTECIQRPSWIRRLERMKGLISKPGTYGVAQVTSSKPISDELSVRILCENHSGYHPISNDADGYNRTLLSVQLEKHNPDPTFVEQALEIFDCLTPDLVESSETYSKDGRKVIEILSLKRQGGDWLIKLSVGPGQKGLTMTTVTRAFIEESSNISISPDIRFRRFRDLVLPIDIRWMELRTLGSMATDENLESLKLDLEDPYLD